MTRDLPLQLLAIQTLKGERWHLYDIEGDRSLTLCRRVIGINPRYLGLGSHRPVSADVADCGKCRALAESLPD